MRPLRQHGDSENGPETLGNGRVSSWKIYSSQRKPGTVRVKVNGQYHEVTPERR